MVSTLKKITAHELIDKTEFPFDIYNKKGNLMYEKGQSLDQGTLLKLNYYEIFRLIEDLNGSENYNFSLLSDIFKLLIKKKHRGFYITFFNDYADLNILTKTGRESVKISKAQEDLLLKEINQLLKINNVSGDESNINFNIGNQTFNFFYRKESNNAKNTMIFESLHNEFNNIENFKGLYVPKNLSNFLGKVRAKNNNLCIISAEDDKNKEFAYSFLKEIYEESPCKILTIENDIYKKVEEFQQFQSGKFNPEIINSLCPELVQGVSWLLLDFTENLSIEKINQILESKTNILLLGNFKNGLEVVDVLSNQGIDKNLYNKISFILSINTVKKLCKSCKIVTNEVNDKVKNTLGHIEDITLYAPSGCNICSNSGYKGLIPIYELFNNKNIQEMLSKHIDNLSYENITDMDFYNFSYDAIKKMLAGLTSFNEIEKLL